MSLAPSKVNSRTAYRPQPEHALAPWATCNAWHTLFRGTPSLHTVAKTLIDQDLEGLPGKHSPGNMAMVESVQLTIIGCLTGSLAPASAWGASH